MDVSYRMKDFIFFPLVFVLALGIIAAAALPGKNRLGCGAVSGAGTNYTKVSVSGNDLCRMVAAGQADVTRLSKGGKIDAVRVSSGAGLLGDRPDRNPHFPLAADLETVFAGRPVKVTVEVKPADDRGATAFEVNYFAGQEGSSGWQTFRLQPGYETFTFEWQVPPRMVCEQAFDYLAIRPVVPDKTRAIDIRKITLEPSSKVPPVLCQE